MIPWLYTLRENEGSPAHNIHTAVPPGPRAPVFYPPGLHTKDSLSVVVETLDGVTRLQARRNVRGNNRTGFATYSNL